MVRCEINMLGESVLDINSSQMRDCEMLFLQIAAIRCCGITIADKNNGINRQVRSMIGRYYFLTIPSIAKKFVYLLCDKVLAVTQ